jgi:two-component system chemotaxis response regulator CheB
MELQRKDHGVVVVLNENPPENSCRPAVDVLFRSVADLYGNRALAVVLTGMGQDGLKGSQRIKEVGGTILAQDEASSVVWGMPGAVVRAGLTSSVVSIELMASEIVSVVRAASLAQAGKAY